MLPQPCEVCIPIAFFPSAASLGLCSFALEALLRFAMCIYAFSPFVPAPHLAQELV